MQINLQNISKRYTNEWIFKGVNYSFETGKRYALLGPNGSGKSTLLQVMSGFLTPTDGKILFEEGGKSLDSDTIFRQVSISGPYVELPEELSLEEIVVFHSKFKKWKNGMTNAQVLAKTSLAEKSYQKELRFFSSGMKQRLKLTLSICSDTEILLLDEPTITLDEEGIAWYKNLLDEFSENRLIVIATNVSADTIGCDEQLEILNFK
jgi:ABC-type multidrug transport system ATPase subunit